MSKLFLAAILLAGCAPSPFTPPPVKTPATVTWIMLSPAAVPSACGHPAATWIEGCAKGTEIITRAPAQGDGELVDILQHEVAHTQGWRHPPHTDGTP